MVDKELKFDPIGAEAEARRNNPAFDAACKLKEEEKKKYLEPIVGYFTILEERTRNIEIAQRFRRDQKPNLLFDIQGGLLPQFKELNEADFKRAQLLDDLNSARAKALILIGEIESLVMDIEATRID